MRCPWYLFHRFFLVWARTQGPHDPLLPGGPMSCQSTPVWRSNLNTSNFYAIRQALALHSGRGPHETMRCPWYLFHRLF
ncbi:unnamed protein product [Staurois parvus]|uniref:Secreted protein n=1 Tax=Staurois parvus TaxID=386267 RepID=A0ABN9DAX4_9NEOB|nr:unnamed protein product [Staurois parvus]